MWFHFQNLQLLITMWFGLQTNLEAYQNSIPVLSDLSPTDRPEQQMVKC